MTGITGKFECTPPSAGNHGPVRVRSTYGNTYHFIYEDNTPYFPVGTTIYSWAQQGGEMEEQTLKTLEKSAFNKIRMVVPPYYYEFNDEEPVYQMCEFKAEETPDYTRFNPEFFRHIEKCLGSLRDLGIEADLILFHCYDRWGHTQIDAEDDERYLKYVISRFASYRNVWWSMANEYDLLLGKTTVDWDRRFKTVQEYDPYGHLRSIHNCGPFYDHAKPWVTHCSIQRVDVYKTAENVDEVI